MKKPQIVPRRRPKSIYAKGWQTRRVNAMLKQQQEALNNLMPAAEPNTTGSAIQSHSEISGRGLSIRDEQICGFLGDMNAIRLMNPPEHAPALVSRSQLNAIEHLLIEMGYSMFGRGTTTSDGLMGTVKDAKSA